MIRKLRIDRGWSQEQLAEFSGLSIRTIQRIESGQKPGLESLKALASVLEVDISELNANNGFAPDSEQSKNLVKDKHQIGDDMYGFYLNLIVFAIIMPIVFFVNYMLTPSYYWAFWVLGAWSLATVLYAILVFDGVGWLQGMFARKP